MIWTNQNALASISQTEHVECSLAGNRIIDPGGLLVVQIRQPWKLLQLILTLHYENNLTATCTFDFENLNLNARNFWIRFWMVNFFVCNQLEMFIPWQM